jgi:hypothetical protein
MAKVLEGQKPNVYKRHNASVDVSDRKIKKKKFSKEDWWLDNGQSPEKLQEWIYDLGNKTD